jgi:hypothetical protein
LWPGAAAEGETKGIENRQIIKRATDSISGKIKPGASRWATLAGGAVLATALLAGAQPALLGQ